MICRLHGWGHRTFQLIQKALYTWSYILYSSSCHTAFGLLQYRWSNTARSRDSILLDMVDGAGRQRRSCFFYFRKKCWMNCLHGSTVHSLLYCQHQNTVERRDNTTKTEVLNLDSDIWVPSEKHKHFTNCKVISLCTFCGEGGGALLDSVELQQQPVQLRQVAAQGWVHGNSWWVTTLLLIRETVKSSEDNQYLSSTERWTENVAIFWHQHHWDSVSGSPMSQKSK